MVQFELNQSNLLYHHNVGGRKQQNNYGYALQFIKFHLTLGSITYHFLKLNVQVYCGFFFQSFAFNLDLLLTAKALFS